MTPSRDCGIPATSLSFDSMSELQDLVALLRAETPLLIIETPDESRVIELFRQSLMHAWRSLYRWSVTEGLRRIDADVARSRCAGVDRKSDLPPLECHDRKALVAQVDIGRADLRATLAGVGLRHHLGYG